VSGPKRELEERDRGERERDREARHLAQCEFERPLVLEAGAGTGKTTVLVARIVVWCLGEGWEASERALAGRLKDPDRVAARILERIVAITFTDLAAAEMAERIGEVLTAIERGESSQGIETELLPASADARSERARALLAHLDRLCVRTIHAYCRRLLAAHPLEIGLHPSFEIDAEGALRDEVVREVTEAAVVEAYADASSSPLLELAGHGIGPGEVEEALRQLVEASVSPEDLREDALSTERIGALLAETRATLDAFRSVEAGRLAGVKRSKRADEVDAGLRELRARLDTAETTVETLAALGGEVREHWEKNLERLRDWARGKFTQGEAAQLESVEAPFRAASARVRGVLTHLRQLDPERLDLARRALQPLLERARGELRARGAETYGALLEDARELLEKHPEVRERVRAGIDQLLVDEFQDTDAVQCEIVAWLALDGAAESRPGLFVVGDPKQSIYAWRGADLGAYEDFVARVRDAGGDELHLSINFRSVPSILEEVERVVAPVMEEVRRVQPEFQRLVARDDLASSPGFVQGDRHSVEHWISWPRESADSPPAPANASSTADLEARALARDIRSLHDEHGTPWSEIGVLFRSRGDLDTYIAALRDEQVPHVVAGDRSYYRRREIIDAAALVRCVLDPNDHLSLLTWLRSAAVGVPDAALLPLWSRGFPAQMSNLAEPDDASLRAIERDLREVAAGLPGDVPGLERIAGWEGCALATIKTVAAARASFERDPSDLFVERLRRGSMIELTEAARCQGVYRVANLERFFRRLVDQLEASGGDPTAVLRDLRTQVERGEAEEEARPNESADDAVQILTIHQAKGLTFTHVYLMQLHKQSGGRADRSLVTGRVNGRLEYRLLGAPTLGLGAVAAQRDLSEAAERVRTLYVAMTRPRERLVLVGKWPQDGEPKPPAEADSHVDLLAHRSVEPPDLEVLAAAPDAAGTEVAEAYWRFPALADAAGGPVEGSEDHGLPALERAAEDARSIRRSRRAASARMQRPTSRPASADPERRPEEPEDEAPRHRERDRGEPGDEGERNIARAVGTAIHRLLEELDLDADPTAELGRLGRQVPAWLEASLDGPERASARERAERLLERLAEGRLIAHLHALRDRVVARELPTLSPPKPGDAEPVGFVAGAIDLLYRDPASGEFVVADFKTDRVADRDEEALAERARAYAAQGAVYTRAVQEALGLDERPRFELWFLDADRIEVVEP
jgi:ATP-dependent helicase/nuclease subunit A